MIQRIQSLYLLIAAVLVALTFVWPIYSYDAGLGTLEVGMFKAGFNSLSGTVQVQSNNFYYPGILAAISVVLSMVTLFLFNNRPLQTRMARLGVLINLGVLVSMIYAVDVSLEMLKDIPPTNGYNYLAFAMPTLAVILSFLASKAIAKDEMMVRSADRLR